MGLPIPEDRHGDATCLVRIRAQVDITQKSRRPDRIGVISLEWPAVRTHVRIDDGHADRVIETAQRAGDQRALRPRAGACDVQVITTRANRGDAIAKHGRRSIERAGGARLAPTNVPFAIDELAHDAVYQ